MAAILIVIFDAQVSRLVQLYVVGVFISFTLSQTGMVRRWWRTKEPGWRRSWPVNAVGAVVTGIVLVVIATVKFSHGAWIVLAAIPVLVFGQPLMDSPDGTHGWLYRGLAMLIIACPCALIISIPVTVKTRLGIDDKDSHEFLHEFVRIVHEQGGCGIFVLHARKAWLKGLSPRENREKPPLHWDRVHRIKTDFPHLEIITNGGFETVSDIAAQFDHVDGVMIGRKAYHEPYFLTELESAVFGNDNVPTRAET